jgi:1-acyl-sn-glycerol-3-phosphate acyltransferase
MPRSGGAVLAVNHFSAIDPPLIGVYSTRTIYYMTKVELLDVPVAGELLRWVGSFAVRRGEGDRDALRVGRWVVREGHIVGMFMEGTRQRFGYPGPVHPGAAMLAIKEGVPVIPCGLDTFGWTLRNPRRCCVVFGEALDLGGLPASGRGFKEGARVIEGEIVRLWRKAAQAIVDGFPDELPDGAKRSRPLRVRDTITHPNAKPWPDEPWAETPLGPVWPGRQA